MIKDCEENGICGASKAFCLSLLWSVWRDRMSWVRQGARQKDTRVCKTAQELSIVRVSYQVEMYMAILLELGMIIGLTAQAIFK